MSPVPADTLSLNADYLLGALPGFSQQHPESCTLCGGCLVSTVPSHHLLGVRAPEALSSIWSLQLPGLHRGQLKFLSWDALGWRELTSTDAEGIEVRGKKGQQLDTDHRPFAYTTSLALCLVPPSLDFLTCLTALL